MWNTVSGIAGVIVIILLFELPGLPDWIRRAFKRKQGDGALARKLEEHESRVRALEARARR